MSSPENSQECPQCRIIFESPPTLKMFTSKGERMHLCPQCNKGFREQSETVDTGTSSSAGKMEGQKTWLCMKCFEKFDSLSDMDTHMRTHSAKSCPNCQSTFSPSPTIKIYSSMGNKIFACPSCQEIFSEPSTTRETDETFFADKIGSGKTWLCILMKFDDISEMDAYVKCHSQPTLIASCHPGSPKKAAVKRSPRTKKKKNFPCHHCSKVFQIKSQLDKHILSHYEKIEKCLDATDTVETVSSDIDDEALNMDISPEAIKMSVAATELPEATETSQGGTSPLEDNIEVEKNKTKISLKKKFKCPHCPRTFKWQLGLDRHIVTHTVEKPYSCNLCEENFKKQSKLQRHVIHDHKFCEKCHTKFETVALLEEHLLTHKRKMVFTCPHCSKVFNRGFKFREHVTSHTGDKPHMCHHCGMKFRLYNNMRRHMRVHTGLKPYSCPHCDKSFSQSGTLKTHLGLHTGEKNHICDKCGKGFGQAATLKQHMYVHTGNRPSPANPSKGGNHTCPVCGCSYKFPGSLQRHMCIHTGETPQGKRRKCPYCEKMYSQAAIKGHINSHTGEKPYDCKICGKKFSSLSNMKRHTVTHSDEKPHVCSQCGKQFNQASYLKAHMNTHILNKPYQCLRCKMRFAEEGKLERHKCFPSRLKLHVCQHCGKGFNRPLCLQKHSCSSTAQNPESVPHIDEGFLASIQQGHGSLPFPDSVNLQFPPH